MISIITATYNRENCIQLLYNSLLNQQSKNFEWIVIDDGSEDETYKVIESFIKENKIKIKFFQQENRGKHVALNLGVREAEGELVFFVDSDDYLELYTIEFIEKEWIKVKDKTNYVGISGGKRFINGNYVGSQLNQEYVDATSIDFRHKYKIQGDKAEVFRTDVIRKYRFPEYMNENFCPEALIYNRIAKDGYILRWFDIPFIVVDYRVDGLSAAKEKTFIKGWKAYSEYVKELVLIKEIPYLFKLKNLVAYFIIMLKYRKPLYIIRREHCEH